MTPKQQIATLNPHLALYKQFPQILKRNVSYLFILPLFDKLNLFILTDKNEKLSFPLFNYLALFNCNNSYLFHENFNNYLWIKVTKIPTSQLIKSIVIDNYHPENIVNVLQSMFINNNLIVKELINHFIIGFPINEIFLNDIEHIKRSEYNLISEKYVKHIMFRTKTTWADDSVESKIVEHAIAYHVINQSEMFKELLSLWFRMPIESIGKNIWKKFNKNNEILMP